MIKKTQLIIPALFLSAFNIALAQTGNSLSGAFVNINTLIKTLTAIAYTLVFLAFFWGLAKYLFTYSDEKKKDAMRLMIMSITIIFIMFSIWGIVKLAQNTLGVRSNVSGSIKLPTVTPKN